MSDFYSTSGLYSRLSGGINLDFYEISIDSISVFLSSKMPLGLIRK